MTPVEAASCRPTRTSVVPGGGRQVAPALLPAEGRSEHAGTALTGICSVLTTTWERDCTAGITANWSVTPFDANPSPLIAEQHKEAGHRR